MLYMTGRPSETSNTSNLPSPVHTHNPHPLSSPQFSCTSTSSYQEGFPIKENALLELPSFLLADTQRHTHTHTRTHTMKHMLNTILAKMPEENEKVKDSKWCTGVREDM